MKRLFRSKRYKMIGGVCGGIAEYFRMDPTIVRVIYVMLSLFTTLFPGIILYIALLFIMPLDDSEEYIDV
ncbi:PspC domain-containing protein [Desulfuribacillus stibiiarsenatis]|nr:PspC domain-containing protein [Desulfuribacillus stibiiarsenatis]